MGKSQSSISLSQIKLIWHCPFNWEPNLIIDPPTISKILDSGADNRYKTQYVYKLLQYTFSQLKDIVQQKLTSDKTRLK